MNLLVLALMSAGVSASCADPQTNAEMIECAGKDYRAADTLMSQAWIAAAALMKQRDREQSGGADKRPGYFAVLLESQRAWLRFRDAQCTTQGYVARGGSMEPLLVLSCKEELTKTRARQLRSLISELDL
jgi:uncharacterized protein YecT (DUF1311 family)